MKTIIVIIFTVIAFLSIILCIFGTDLYYRKKAKMQKLIASSCLKKLGKGPVVLDDMYKKEAELLGFPIKQYAQDKRLCPVVMWDKEKELYKLVGAKKQILCEDGSDGFNPCYKIIVNRDGKVSENTYSGWRDLYLKSFDGLECDTVSAKEYFETEVVSKETDNPLDDYRYEEIYHEPIDFR